jgi:hypothetical protein
MGTNNNKLSETELPAEKWYREHYLNSMQLRANAVDSNVLIAEVARAGGKTEGVTGPRITKVANSMPGELGFLVHKTYVALMTNVWPNIQAYFNQPVIDGTKTLLQYGIDYVVGESKPPSHFKKPRYPIPYPKHCILFRNGFHLQLVSSDQPESVAGRSAVHAFIEEMKHNKGEKLKSRLFPSLRGAGSNIRMSPYYQGITGVSDTARVDLGEDNWFEEYEINMDMNRVNEIVTVACKLDGKRYEYYRYQHLLKQEKNPVVVDKINKEMRRLEAYINLWTPRLNDQRRNASYYIRASSFVNKDFLGPKFFKTQYELLEPEEFLTAICAIRIRAVVDRFFANYVPRIHEFNDSYRYQSILSMDLRDSFRLTSKYLKYYNANDELLLGYDPGSFQSIVVAQEKRMGEELRVIKNFTCYAPREQADIAREFNDFFGEDSINKHIKLYYDRAGNKRKEELDQITTDARILKRELEAFGFTVDLMNEGQPTIYYWQQFKLLLLIYGEKTNFLPRVRHCASECKDLNQSIMISPRKKSVDGKIELDKTSEKKIPFKYQAARSTQLPSALIYLLFGLYGEKLPSEFSYVPEDLPEVGIL